MQKRHFLQTAAATLASAAFGTNAFAQPQDAWPQRPIRLVVPFPPGGGTDTTSRLIAEKLTTGKGWTIVVDNKPGAAGNIGLDAVAKSAPDGYVLGMGQSSNLTINPALYAKMPFDPVKDFTPIVEIAAQPIILAVRTDSPFRTLADFIAAAKKQPGGLGVAQAGSGTVGHLAAEMLARRANIQMLQVPYKGAAPAMTDLLGGQVAVYFGSSVSIMAQLKGGKVRALAVTSAKRLPTLPDVPTVAEQGYPGFDAVTWVGLVGPAGMPASVVARINTEVVRLLGTKEVQERLAVEGSVPATGTPQQFATLIQKELGQWGTLVREAGIKLD